MKLIHIQPQNTDIHTPQGWRTWINDLTHWQQDLLHNHRAEGGEIYRYPLVQYSSNGFIGINEGATLLLKILPLLEVETNILFHSHRFEIAMTHPSKKYYLKRWQPFNSENYRIWNETSGLSDRVKQLEGILIGNILGFCRAVGFEIPNKALSLKIIGNLEDLGFQRFSTLNAELHRRTFGIEFEANIDLPMGIGLGRGSSKGYGNLHPAKVIKTKSNNQKIVVG